MRKFQGNRYLALSLAIGMAGLTSISFAKSFSDLGGYDWAKGYIEEYADKNILNGYEDGTFRPEQFVTREEFAKIIVTAFDYETDSHDGGFHDVAQGDWFAPYVNTLANLKIVNGVETKRFGVGENITRQDICTILMRVLEQKGYTLKIDARKTLSFVDNSAIDSYAWKAVQTLYQAGVINGVSDKEFRPKDYATRAQMVKLVYLANHPANREEAQETKPTETQIPSKENDVPEEKQNVREKYDVVTQYEYTRGTAMLQMDDIWYEVMEGIEVSGDIVGDLVLFDTNSNGKIKRLGVLSPSSFLANSIVVSKVEGDLVKLEDNTIFDLEAFRDEVRKSCRVLVVEAAENTKHAEGYDFMSVEEISAQELTMKAKNRVMIHPIDGEYDDIQLVMVVKGME